VPFSALPPACTLFCLLCLFWRRFCACTYWNAPLCTSRFLPLLGCCLSPLHVHSLTGLLSFLCLLFSLLVFILLYHLFHFSFSSLSLLDFLQVEGILGLWIFFSYHLECWRFLSAHTLGARFSSLCQFCLWNFGILDFSLPGSLLGYILLDFSAWLCSLPTHCTDFLGGYLPGPGVSCTSVFISVLWVFHHCCISGSAQVWVLTASLGHLLTATWRVPGLPFCILSPACYRFHTPPLFSFRFTFLSTLFPHVLDLFTTLTSLGLFLPGSARCVPHGMPHCTC